MSAVLRSDNEAIDCLELRSAALTLMTVVLKTTDVDVLGAELSRRAAAVPGVFDDEPVAVDLSSVRDAEAVPDFHALVVLLCHHGMRPVAARGGNEAQMEAARAAGLLEAPEGARSAPPPLPAPQIVERVVEVQLAPLPPLVIDKPLRSGQQVWAHDRDLIVLALVSHGAEVLADGDIHVYAPLRGRAHAGAKGNVNARIYCHRMEAQVLAIADVFRTTDEPLPAAVAGRPAMVRRAGDRLEIEPLG
jgi:septum site-determining protein MinC